MEVVKSLGSIIYEPITEEYGWGKYGDFRVIIRLKDGYINATKLCRAGGKELKHWNATALSKQLIEALAKDMRVPTSSLAEVFNCGYNRLLAGTYFHQNLIPFVAYWISPKFGVFISRIIREWRLMSPENEKIFWEEMGNCILNFSSETNKEEERWKLKIALEEEGSVEAYTRSGYIDVLTKTKVIEVKHACSWKHALGQVLSYWRDHKDKTPALYLFDWKEELREIIEETCAEYGVEVLFLR